MAFSHSLITLCIELRLHLTSEALCVMIKDGQLSYFLTISDGALVSCLNPSFTVTR